MAGSNFVDYVKIFARSGHGGAGSCHFRREKFVAFGGPDGGDGGKGGSIILQGDSQYWTLIHLKYKRHQFAEDGENGHGARSTGADAKDIIIPVPLGTVAKQVFTDEETGEEKDFEVLASATIDEKLYYALVPADDDGDEYVIHDDKAVLEFFAQNVGKADFAEMACKNADFWGEDLSLYGNFSEEVTYWYERILNDAKAAVKEVLK